MDGSAVRYPTGYRLFSLCRYRQRPVLSPSDSPLPGLTAPVHRPFQSQRPGLLPQADSWFLQIPEDRAAPCIHAVHDRMASSAQSGNSEKVRSPAHAMTEHTVVFYFEGDAGQEKFTLNAGPFKIGLAGQGGFDFPLG